MLSDLDAFQNSIVRKALEVHLAQIKGEIACGKRKPLDIAILQSHQAETEKILALCNAKPGSDSKAERQRAALAKAAETFDKYAVHHYMKGSTEKQGENEKLATLCREALK